MRILVDFLTPWIIHRSKLLWWVGLTAALAFAPHHYWLCGVVSLLILMTVGWFCPSWKQAWRWGWWWGWGFYMGTLYWIGNALWVDASRFAWLWPLVVLGGPALLALYPAVMMGLLVALRCSYRRRLAPYGLAFTLLWSGMEWIQGHAFTGFPWNLTAYMWGDLLPIAQTAALVGSYGLGFLTVLWISLMGCIILHHDTSAKDLARGFMRAVCGGLGIFVLALGFGYQRLRNHPTAFHGDIILRCVQPNLSQREKMDPSLAWNHWQNLLRLSSLPVETKTQNFNVSGSLALRSASPSREDQAPYSYPSSPRAEQLQSPLKPTAPSEGKAFLAPSGESPHPHGKKPTHILWPEGALPWCMTPETLGYFPEAGDLVILLGGDYMIQSQPQIQLPPHVSGFQGTKKHIYNGLMMHIPGKSLRFVYAKRHLVPGGEYFPCRAFFSAYLPQGWLQKITPGAMDFSQGAPIYGVMCPGLPPLRALICYESIFPSTLRPPAPGYRRDGDAKEADAQSMGYPHSTQNHCAPRHFKVTKDTIHEQGSQEKLPQPHGMGTFREKEGCPQRKCSSQGRRRYGEEDHGLTPEEGKGCIQGSREGEPQWILNLTNDGWFGNSAGPHQHFLSARFRAIEEGLPLVRVANTGISALVDPLGRVLQALPLGKEGALDGPLPRAIHITPYGRWGDRLWGMLMGLGFLSWLLCMAFGGKRDPRKDPR